MDIVIPARLNCVDRRYIRLQSDLNNRDTIRLWYERSYGQYTATFYAIEKDDAIEIAKQILRHYNVDSNNQL